MNPTRFIAIRRAASGAAVLFACGLAFPAQAGAGAFRILEPGLAVPEAEGAVARIVVVREGGDPDASASVAIATVDDTARAGLDYAALSARLDFPAGVATNAVDIPILDNVVLHTHSPATVAPRRFFVRLSDPSDGATLAANPHAGVAILDDELVPRAWIVRPAEGGWSASDEAALDALVLEGGAFPAEATVGTTTFEEADPAALFDPRASSCVFLDFGPREASYAAAWLSARLGAIEAWVRAGGRLLVNAAPSDGGGIIPLPFGASIAGATPLSRAVYLVFADGLCWAPSALEPDPSYWVRPAQAVPDVSPASVLVPDGIEETQGVLPWLLRYEGMERGKEAGLAAEDLFALFSAGAGSAACASLRPPSQLVCGAAGEGEGSASGDGSAFWGRLLLWAFRPDGLSLVATDDWAPQGIAGDAASFSPPAKLHGVCNLGSGDADVAVSADVPWLVPETSSATIPAGEVASVRIALAPEALAFPEGTYTGVVTFASTRPFCEAANLRGQALGRQAYPGGSWRRTVVLSVNPPSGTLADPGAGPAMVGAAHPGATGGAAVVATLRNLSDALPVRILSASFSGTAAESFRVVSPASFPAEVEASGTLDVVIAFAPARIGAHRATLTLCTGDPEHPRIEIEVRGRCVPLELQPPVLRDGGSGCEVSWTSLPGVSYEILSTDDLSLPFAPIGTAEGASGSVTEHLDPRPHAAARFYKVRLP